LWIAQVSFFETPQNCVRKSRLRQQRRIVEMFDWNTPNFAGNRRADAASMTVDLSFQLIHLTAQVDDEMVPIVANAPLNRLPNLFLSQQQIKIGELVSREHWHTE